MATTTTTTYIQPVQWTVKKLDRTGSIPGVGASTFPRGAKGQLP